MFYCMNNFTFLSLMMSIKYVCIKHIIKIYQFELKRIFDVRYKYMKTFSFLS